MNRRDFIAASTSCAFLPLADREPLMMVPMSEEEQTKRWQQEIESFCWQIKNYARDHSLDRDHLHLIFHEGLGACFRDGLLPMIPVYKSGELPGRDLTPEEEKFFPKATPAPKRHVRRT